MSLCVGVLVKQMCLQWIFKEYTVVYQMQWTC